MKSQFIDIGEGLKCDLNSLMVSRRMKPKRIIEVNRGAVRASPMLFD